MYPTHLIEARWKTHALSAVHDALVGMDEKTFSERRQDIATVVANVIGGLEHLEAQTSQPADDWPDWTDDDRWTITEPTTPIEVLSPIADATPVYEPTAEELADYHAYRDEQDRVHSAAWKAHLDAIDSAEYATRQRLNASFYTEDDAIAAGLPVG